ncbi:MAG: gamma-glutamyl kinase [Pseudomonadota bacterium]
MLLFYNEKLVLFAQPKTGTTALERALAGRATAAILDPPRLKHTSVRRYRRELEAWITRDRREPFETMALIREPVDWLGSWYRYRRRAQIAGQSKSTEGVDFDAFVRAWMQEERPDFARVGSQSRFVTGGRGRLLVTHLFRYEAYDAALAFLETRLGEKIETKPVNVSPKMGLALSAETEAALREYAARDFELWEGARQS